MTDWRNRIVRYSTQAADQFLANPKNPRRHPQNQRDAVKGSLDALGWIAPVIVNARSGYMIDGHERVMQALAQGDETDVPFIEIDLSEDEEALALASFDWITQLATYERDTLDSLLRDVNTDNAALQTMLSEMAERTGAILPAGGSWADAFGGLPEDDRAPFQQMTFTLHDAQAQIVKDAIERAKQSGAFDSDNENSNGNALARICEVYLDG